MNIVVTDANILIDLCELDILEEFFSLPYSMSVVEAVQKIHHLPEEHLPDLLLQYQNYCCRDLKRKILCLFQNL